MANGEQTPQDETPSVGKDSAEMTQQMQRVTEVLGQLLEQGKQLATNMQEGLEGLQKAVRELAEKGTTERQKAINAAKKVLTLGASLVAVGFVVLMVAIYLLERMHIHETAAAAVSHTVTSAGSSALTLTNISWPASSLGWAGAVAFLGFAGAIAAIVIAMAASLSRLAGQDF